MILTVFSRMFLMSSLGSRVAATIIAAAFWLAFIILYLTFFASSFDMWQKLAIFSASAAIVVGTVVAMWAKWILK
ncbi:MAG: hypothetical protein JSW53_01850 [Candidatus Bathyarchaeota archaeon]|nr:MAG: hypothetical protein JSW53_01850 [Candidatus Bathyarchaeota archaeon]